MATPTELRTMAVLAVKERSKVPISCRLRLVCERDAAIEAERLLCARAKEGDRRALGELLRTHGPRLYRSVLLPRLGQRAIAEEALATTYTRVIERFHQFEWQDVGVYPWLRVIAFRVAIDHLRRQRRERLFQPEDLERALEAAQHEDGERAELLERQDLEVARQRVAALLGELNERYALAIRLRILDGHPREQCAVTLGVTVSTFDVVLHRALASLKKHLDRQTERELEPHT
jgi:RNA polymerase sigma-70 factor (ECF subfamily)